MPEHELKQLCDIVCDLLLEESNIQVNLTLNLVLQRLLVRYALVSRGLDPNLVTHKIDIFKKSQAFLQGVFTRRKVKRFRAFVFFYADFGNFENCRIRTSQRKTK